MRSKYDGEDWEETAQHPEETVDALEERVSGRTVSRDDQHQGDNQDQEGPTPAIEQSLDSDDLGSADVGTEPSD